MAPGLTLHLPSNHPFAAETKEPDAHYAFVSHAHGGIAAFGDTVERRHDGIRSVERVVGLAVDGDQQPSVGDARARARPPTG